MKVIRIFSSILIFIEINLLSLLVFIICNYLLFKGEEKVGTMVTIITTSFFILSIILSSFLARRMYLYLKDKSDKRSIVIFIIALVAFIGTISLFNLSAYILQ